MKNMTIEKTVNLRGNGSFLPLQPHRIITLWDMIQFLLHEFMMRWEELLTIQRHYEDVGIKSAGELVPPADFIRLESLVDHLHYECKKLQMPNSIDRLWRFGLRLERDVCTNSIVMAELQAIHSVIEYEMDNNYFAFIPADKIDFFEKDGSSALFGKAVYDAFPDARIEIKDAGKCLAAELNTAAVFHLMRVAEFGLRKLAKPFGIKLPHQIEFATWGGILTAIQTELDKKGVRRAKAKEEKLQRYSLLLLNIKAFQHLWRNPVSHLRGCYDELQARSAFNHVRSFKQNLSQS